MSDCSTSALKAKEPSGCRHMRGPMTTLRMRYIGGVGVTLWYCECIECGNYTEGCLTWGEALARAEKGWWKNDE